ncbi:uncharacterized protein LOC128279077 [Anopheles cruzii]|uniref:uncharacterized protein LOC128279077 n=1 Tax=Anopheles cruzii TaxID=68878 RepID=UPI0022EC2737|nr:uncharacterized protein LOC128279077 [Anopheles cruzii]
MRKLQPIVASVLLLCWSIEIKAENLLTSFEIIHGYIYPPSVTVAEGEWIYLRLLVPKESTDRCLYREPGSRQDIEVPASGQQSAGDRRDVSNQHARENECGIRVSSVQERHAGFWRLTLERGTDRIRGVTMVDVIKRPVVPEVSDGSVGSLDDLSPDRTEYCYVQRSDGGTERLDVPMHERCTLPLTETDPTGAGIWQVVAGVQGQMREMTYGVNIENNEEQIVPSVRKESNFHILSCQLRYTKLMLKFCRFFRLADNFGLNVIPGLGTSRYNYAGAGFERNECGLEILDPDGLDKGLWKCVLGYGDAQQTKVSGAILDNLDTVVPLAIIGRSEGVTAQNGTLATLQCNVNKPIDYCWFRGPHGQFYSLSESLTPTENTGHWYSGISLAMGDCGIALEAITDGEHAGLWRCYAGNGRVSAVEVSASFMLRISASQLIGVADRVEIRDGFPAMLGCDSIPKGTPLQHCRFVTPTGDAFSLNENVTHDRPILERFYSNPNHDLAKGSCSLVIATVRPEDAGRWICAGKIHGHATEHTASVELVTNVGGEERATLSAASISGMVIGSIAIVLGAFVVGCWHYRKRLHRDAAAVVQGIEMRSVESVSQISRRRVSNSMSVTSSDSNTSSQGSHRNLHSTL